ncbi:MAG: hypothetical protein KBA60_09640 [Flavobacteriales bacterium]|nr:hypothetical protein [Flavobacteriales bacterium]MBP6643340.1 hypothetical protein [Flavobacteriales bacterium]MBP7156260.1 hypothetical protein [Flavobacteriales bacterium]HQV76214.1 hypothetical protein [Flavobacteriales bacterium]HQW41901.1 hypothetical protein [Flavobacteriales bacterium]
MGYRNVLFLVAAISVLALHGCYYDNEEELYPNNFCDTSNVTFNATVFPLVQTRCAIPGCHVTGSQSPNLTQAAEVLNIASNGNLRQFAVVDKSMPPTGPLPECDRLTIQTWLDAGAPNN